jgi:succinate dehydrogenase/fumarate reductase flavoprotein subunit
MRRLVPVILAALVVAGATAAEREEIEARKRTIEKHLLKVQQQRFEAQARGESPARLERLEREFQRTQQRRIEAMRELHEGR